MRGVGEHVDGLYLLHGVSAVLSQKIQVPRHCLGIAGDIDHPFGRHFYQRAQKLLAAACTRRIHEYHVAALVLLGARLHEFACVAFVKADVLQLVELCVADGVAHRVSVQLNADDPPCALLCGDDADGADPAVGVKHGFVSFQMGIFHRFSVQGFGLDGINLIEAFRRNAEAASAENILDIAFAVEDGLPLSEDEIGVEIVDVLHNGSDGGKLLPDRAHEVVFGGEYGSMISFV